MLNGGGNSRGKTTLRLCRMHPGFIQAVQIASFNEQIRLSRNAYLFIK